VNILLINHNAGSNRHGMEYRPFYLARQWVRHGHRVVIVAASFSHARQVSPQTRGSVSIENLEGIQYIWLKTPEYHGNDYKRALNILAFVYAVFRNSSGFVRDFPADIVIGSSTYPLDIIPARRLADKSGAKLVFEVHDLWPLSLIEVGGMSRYHPFVMLLQWAEDYAYRHADRVISMLPKALDYMMAHGMLPAKFAYVPNGIDVEEWESDQAPLPETHRKVVDDLQQSNRFLIGYAGAHGLANALDAVIEAADQLQSQPVTFVLVGQGPEKSRLQENAVKRGLTNVAFLPPVPKASVPALLDAMDVLYIGLKNATIFRFGVSPNKLIDYMMAGKPIIHAIDAGNDLVAESGCGISIMPEDPAAIASAVLNMSTKPASERDAMGALGKSYVLAHHDYRVLAQRFLEVVLQ